MKPQESRLFPLPPRKRNRLRTFHTWRGGGPASAQKSSYTTTEEGKQPPKFPPLRLGSPDLHVRMQPSIFLPTIIFLPTVAGRKRWQESKCAEVVRDLYCVMQQYHRTRSLLETRVTETSMALSHGQTE